MNAHELIDRLRTLDSIKKRKDSFSSWLYGNDTDKARYEKIIQEIERAFPGMKVTYVDVTYREAHVLMPVD